MRLSERIRRRVRERAGHRCEYCHLQEEDSPLADLHVEHVMARCQKVPRMSNDQARNDQGMIKISNAQFRVSEVSSQPREISLGSIPKPGESRGFSIRASTLGASPNGPTQFGARTGYSSPWPSPLGGVGGERESAAVFSWTQPGGEKVRAHLEMRPSISGRNVLSGKELILLARHLLGVLPSASSK